MNAVRQFFLFLITIPATVIFADAAVKPAAPAVVPIEAKPAIAPKPAEAVVPASAIKNYESSNYYGEPVRDEKNNLRYVDENKSQTHSKDEYVMVRVKGIKSPTGNENGRIRVAIWNDEKNYAKEGVAPFRASSHWAKDVVGNEMVFKIAGLEKGKSYSFFAHFDQSNKGKVVRNFIGIPKDPFIFSNAKNQGKGPGLTRQGLSAPQFKNTLVKYVAPGQEIILTF